MNDELRAVDVLSDDWAQVDPFSGYRDVVSGWRALPGPAVFAVVSAEGHYQGLVEARKAALFPGRIFADLLVSSGPEPVAPDAPLSEVIQRLKASADGHLAVVTGEVFEGVVSRGSLFAFLAEHERGLREEREALVGRLEEELANSRVAAAVFEATSEGIMVTDPRVRIIQVNPAFTNTTGYTAEEASGQTPRLLHSGCQGRDFYGEMWEQLRQADSWEGEIWNRRKSGEIYPEWLHIDAIRDEEGELQYYVGVFSDASRHAEVRARLQHLAYHDVLTGLPNRQLLLEHLEHALGRAQRGHGFALLYVDLDGFKDINDTLGHSVGDALLVAAARRLREGLREADVVARIGGDEFVILLPDIAEEEAAAGVADKIQELFRAPLEVEGREFHLRASIGISMAPRDGSSADALMVAADSAMYLAKDAGKGTYRFHSAEAHRRFSERVALVEELRAAIGRGELHIVWQPQVALEGGRIVGMEALARWHRADGEAVPPPLFIELAEHSGLIQDLGDWLIEVACRDLQQLDRASPDGSLRAALNFSPLQIGRGGARRLLDSLEDHGVDPARLELELTETQLALGRDGVMELLQTMGEAGVHIAVDDFGTGCSNIATIRQLPVQKLKIDRSFVQDLARGASDRTITSAMVNMARTLELSVVAEGIEEGEQHRLLREMQCHYGQGYLYSRPCLAEDLADVLRRGHVEYFGVRG